MRALSVLAGLMTILCPGAALAIDIPTIYDNMHMFPIGSRAAGMGGAYTALGCDEAALHYNPAALGCAGTSRLELSANVYMLQAESVPNAFGEGQDIDAITYHAVPSIVGGVRVLRDPDDDDGSGRVTFGINVEVPHSLALKADPAKPSVPNFLQVRVRDQITAGDVGVGWQINKYIAIGASLGAALRTFEANIDTLATDDFFVPCIDPPGQCLSFLRDSSDIEALAVGGRGKIGLRISPSESTRLGLMIVSPTLNIFGTSTIVQGTAFSVGDPNTGEVFFFPFPARVTGDSDISLPMRIALGFAYETDAFTLSADASLAFPYTARTAYNLEAARIRNIPPLSSDDLDDLEYILDRTWQPNFNLGAEFQIVEDVVIDIGAFTDLSSVSSKAVREDSADQVHMFGGTTALGLQGKQARGWFGLSFEYGQGTSRVASGTLNLNTVLIEGLDFDTTSTITRWTLAGFIGSNYSFFPIPEDEEAEEEPIDERPSTTPAPQPEPEERPEAAPEAVLPPPAEPEDAAPAEPDVETEPP